MKNIYYCFIDYTKSFYGMYHNNLLKVLNRWAYQTILPVSCETCMWVKKQQLEIGMEQLTDSKLGKEYNKAVYCHPAYMQSIS